MNLLATWNLLAQAGGDDGAAAAAAAGGAIALFILLFEIVLLVAMFAGLWMIFTKAGKPGWAAIVPIYNVIVLLEIAGKPLWWVLLFFIPCINIIISLLVFIDVAKNFGKGTGYAIGMWLLPFIFMPLLGFSDAQYRPVAS